jgi:hypothetical protein
MFFVTTEQAPTIKFFPIVTPFKIVVCAPINTLSSNTTEALVI